MCVCVCVCVRERERERDRQTDRQTDRQRQFACVCAPGGLKMIEIIKMHIETGVGRRWDNSSVDRAVIAGPLDTSEPLLTLQASLLIRICLSV